MTDLSTISSPFQEALCVHTIFLAAGVALEDIFVSYEDDRRFIVVAVEGSQKYAVGIGSLEFDRPTFEDKWTHATVTYNAATHDDRAAFTRKAQIRGQATMIIAELVSRGMGRAKQN